MENPIPWTDSLGREGEGRGGIGRGERKGEGSGRVRRRENVRVKKSKGGKWRAKVRGVSKSGGE